VQRIDGPKLNLVSDHLSKGTQKMKTRIPILAVLVFSMFAAQGCTRVNVRKVTGDCDKGIRYYRPKPYLFISGEPVESAGEESTFTINQNKPVDVKTTSNNHNDSVTQLASHQEGSAVTAAPATLQSEKTKTDIGPHRIQKLTMALQYLPDFSEEYSIDYKPGLGIGELNVTLENGWNLTSIGIKTDQQTDEIISSVASAIGQIANPASALESTGDASRAAPANLYGTNVPFGFYEAVISCDPRGRKQLYGWRYIGFMPFQACPINAGGLENVCCSSNAIYGLVFVNGVLQFQKIGEIPINPVGFDGSHQPNQV
jgi:hypothetical protein